MCVLIGSSNAQEWTSYKSIEKVNDYLDTGAEFYMATDAGLVIVDKNTLEYSIHGIEGSDLSTDHFSTVARSSSGEIFIGTYDVVVARFDGSDFKDTIVPDGLNYEMNPQLYDIKITETGELWLATSQGVFRQLGTEWVKYDKVHFGFGFDIAWDIEIDEEGAVYISSLSGVHKFENDSWTHLSAGTSLFRYSDGDVFISNAGDVFFADEFDSIGRFDGESWTVYPNGGLDGGEINGFTEDLEGNIYFDTWHDGVFKLTGDTWSPYEEEISSVGGSAASFYHVDEQGTRWCSQNIYLSSNKDGNIESTKLSPTTIEHDFIYDIKKGSNGELLFLMKSSTHSISILSPDGEWSLLKLPENIYYWNYYGGDILYLNENDIWISHADGLYHYNGADWISHAIGFCETIVQDSQGRIYVQGEKKVFIIENDIISEYNAENSPLVSVHHLEAIGVDAEDNLWLGFDNFSISIHGSHVIQKVSSEGEWTTYSRDDHDAIVFPRGEFHFDTYGNMWVPSSHGVIKFDGQVFSNPILENSAVLDIEESYSIESDTEGRIYMATDGGLMTYHEGEWQELYYDDLSGQYILVASIKFDDSGRLWWGSVPNGLYSIDFDDLTDTNDFFQSTGTKVSLYPNPAHNWAIINFSVLESAEVSLAIYNKLGQNVSILDLGRLQEGNYEQGLNLDDFPAGVYVVHLTIGKEQVVKNLIID